MKASRDISSRTFRLLLGSILISTYLLPASSAAVDIANTPLIVGTTTQVYPNLMFILDDSGSMGWNYMPDNASGFNSRALKSKHCNGLAYNPTLTYTPPVNADGTSFPDMSYTSAYSDGINKTGATDLSKLSSGTGATYYNYTGTQADLDFTSSTFKSECTTGSTSLFSVVYMNSATAAQQTNYANWYSYYRTRILMMKTSVSLAFAPIGDNYRVGYMTINDNTGKDFLNISDFDSTQKSSWYAKLFAATPSNGTPLRSALSTAGLIYAGKMNGLTFNGSTVVDPIQYSCQQNFTILSTDGYWNTGHDSGCSGQNGAGCNLSKTSGVGNQDNDDSVPLEARPSFDGGTVTNASNTLADVAMYYYKTDLRSDSLGNCTGSIASQNVCSNNVYTSSQDGANWQHMDTFTLGLGAQGAMKYSPTYESDTSGDYYNVKTGAANSSTKSPCWWSAASQPCNWAVPTSNSYYNIDDLWHAAVNGRGTYYSATDPSTLATGLKSALAGLASRLGASSSVPVSNPNPTAGDNFAFGATYLTGDWTGEVAAYQIDLTTGAPIQPPVWQAQAQLDTLTSLTGDSRTIYTYDPTNSPTYLKPFAWANLTSTEQDYFNATKISSLSQWSSLTSTEQGTIAGSNLVGFIRGWRQYEGTKSTNSTASNTIYLYRSRAHILGDIVSSTGAYVKAPIFSYSDYGYYTTADSLGQNFKTLEASRAGRLYVGANDGMLHAFDSGTGAEVWAYVPSLMLPNLYKLADENYAANHQYYVDGSPAVGDICPTAPTSTCLATQWKTILVGGYNAGGRGYYALDVTDPNNPKVLWEFTDNTISVAPYTNNAQNLGLSFGNPIITKLADGTWVVLIASGYNNTSPGDGNGHLFILNANDGTIINDISTNTAAGLAMINAWSDNTTIDNTSTMVYGGDLNGNMWRFDINGTFGTPAAYKLATALGPTSTPQPITGIPQLGLINNTYHVIYFGTGKLLGISDLTDTNQASPNLQSFYAVKDPLDSTTAYTNIRNTTGVQVRTTTQTTTAGGTVAATTSGNTVNWDNTTAGWYFDLPGYGSTNNGERMNTNPILVLGTISFLTNTPDPSTCNVGGYSWLYYLDYATGLPVSSSDGTVGHYLTNSFSTGLTAARLADGSVVVYYNSNGSVPDGTEKHIPGTEKIPTYPPSSSLKRINWREVIQQ